MNIIILSIFFIVTCSAVQITVSEHMLQKGFKTTAWLNYKKGSQLHLHPLSFQTLETENSPTMILI